MKVIKIKHPDQILFDEKDIEKTFSFWEGRKYEEKIKLFGSKDKI